MKIRTMQVVANPYCALDPDGRAQGAVGKEGTSGQWIGAQKCHQGSEATGKNIFVFSSEPVTVPYTAYYARKILDGDLFAADVASAKLAGIPEKEFVSPEKLLAEARDIADVAHFEQTGEEAALLKPVVEPKKPEPDPGVTHAVTPRTEVDPTA